jgi:hypothetical protein
MERANRSINHSDPFFLLTPFLLSYNIFICICCDGGSHFDMLWKVVN